MRFIPLGQLKGGEILAQNIINANNQIMLMGGSILNDKLITKLKRYGVQSVYIKDPDMEPYLKDQLKDTIKPEIRQQSISSIKKSIEKFQASIVKQKKSSKYGDDGKELHEDIKAISGSLIDEILNAKNTKVAMMDIKSLQDYNYEHSVNVAVLSLIVGVEMGLNIEDLENLAIGAMMIDIGNRWVDDRILKKEGKLTDDEYEELKKHPRLGYEYITNNTILNAHIKCIIAQHHERINGSGYPSQMKGDKIHRLAKIVMIADVYDALTSDRGHRGAFPQYEALEFIMANAGTLFDFEIASIFSRKVVPYPVGTYVLLSNQQKGVVLENNANLPLRPKVRSFGKSQYTSNYELQVDLKEANNIVIKRVIYAI